MVQPYLVQHDRHQCRHVWEIRPVSWTSNSQKGSIYGFPRGAPTVFDQLAAPKALHPWFGRPAITLQELISASGLDACSLCKFVDDVDHDLVTLDMALHPVSAVWPMGFSWSSAVAQGCTIECVLASGVREDCILCMDQPPPADQHELCTVVTDDTILMHRDAEFARMRLLDAAFGDAGIPRNTDKDISVQPSIVALGCELSSIDALVQPEVSKLARLTCGLLDVITNPVASPRGLHSLLGLLQWFSLLQRGLFSVYDAVYEFVRREPSGIPVPLPQEVVVELSTALFLLPLLPASMDRPFLPKLIACDACPDFGFGVSALCCHRDVAASIGRLAERRGD